MMLDKVRELSKEVEGWAIETQEQLEAFRVKYISRKSVIGDLFSEFKNVVKEEKKHLAKS